MIKNETKKQFHKINLHILEICNYKCEHCFAHFDSQKLLTEKEWEKIVDNCIENTDVEEFNIAGGEPLLYKDLMKLVKYIHKKGKLISIITNGSLISDLWIEENAKYFTTIGFSIDSVDRDTLIKQGRHNNQKYLSKERFEKICEKIKEINPNCKIKINTVVTKHNLHENLGYIINTLPISRWKILKMDIFQNDSFNNSKISTTNEEYNNFLKENLKSINNVKLVKKTEHCKNYSTEFGEIICEQDLKATYVMIDSNGYLVDDSLNNNYTKVCNCLTENIQNGLEKLNFDEETYNIRY